MGVVNMEYLVYHPVDKHENDFIYNSDTNSLSFIGSSWSDMRPEYEDKPSGMWFKYRMMYSGKKNVLCNIEFEKNITGKIYMDYDTFYPVLYLALRNEDGYMHWNVSSGGKYINWTKSIGSTFDTVSFFLRLPYIAHDVILNNGLDFIFDRTSINTGIDNHILSEYKIEAV